MQNFIEKFPLVYEVMIDENNVIYLGQSELITQPNEPQYFSLPCNVYIKNITSKVIGADYNISNFILAENRTDIASIKLTDFMVCGTLYSYTIIMHSNSKTINRLIYDVVCNASNIPITQLIENLFDIAIDFIS